MEISKQEINSLKKFGYSIDGIREPNGEIIKHFIVISNGNKKLHDSGYPLIKIIGFDTDKRPIDLGYHDHFYSNVALNIDSLGKNIFRVMLWSTDKRFKVEDNFCSTSSFSVGSILGDDGEEFVYLR